MPAHRLPEAKSKALGRDTIQPGRHKARKAPKVHYAVGEPFPYMTDTAKAAWLAFCDEIPWLNKSHRAILEVVSNVRALMMDGEDVGVTKLNMYQSCLSKLGATPSDASKVTAEDDDEDDEGNVFS